MPTRSPSNQAAVTVHAGLPNRLLWEVLPPIGNDFRPPSLAQGLNPTGSTQEIIEFLKINNINIYCAALQVSTEYQTQDYTKPTAIVVGTEATGLTNEWLENSHQNIIIPMQGEIDSINVSVAAGILIFEAVRQRRN